MGRDEATDSRCSFGRERGKSSEFHDLSLALAKSLSATWAAAAKAMDSEHEQTAAKQSEDDTGTARVQDIQHDA
jgi:hypothetical protein